MISVIDYTDLLNHFPKPTVWPQHTEEMFRMPLLLEEQNIVIVNDCENVVRTTSYCATRDAAGKTAHIIAREGGEVVNRGKPRQMMYLVPYSVVLGSPVRVVSR